MLGFEEGGGGGGEPEYPKKNLSEKGGEPTTKSAYVWCRRRDLNPCQFGGRRSTLTTAEGEENLCRSPSGLNENSNVFRPVM